MARLRFFSVTVLLGALCACACLFGTDKRGDWLRGIPLDKAIRIGNGSHAVIEISDPDCQYSRQMARYWNMRKDVTRYVFLVALKDHVDAPQKARYILSSPDKAAAYQEVYSGGLDFDEKRLDEHFDDGGLLKLHQEVADRLGAIGTPTYVLEGVKISGAKVDEIEKLLGGEKIPFKIENSM